MLRPLALVLLVFTACGAEDGGVELLFNGRDLDGWSGDTGHWSVEDGCLVGRSTAAAPLERSVYLFAEAEAADFELVFEYRIEGGNSGMQYRSLRLPDGEVAGYQADIEDGESYTGILYESGGRAIVAERGERLRITADGRRVNGEALGDRAALQRAVRDGDWNRYRIVARGARLVHEINGVRMVDVLDQEEGARHDRGVFALQLHQGPPMEVRFRGIELRRLGDGEDAALEPFPKLSPPAPTARRAEWIWGAEPVRDGERRWFLCRFELELPAVVAGGELSCDNAFAAWLDGDALARGDDWMQPVAVAGGRELPAGLHLLAVEASNLGGPAGLAARLEFKLADGRRRSLVSDAAWRTTSEEPQGWPEMAAGEFGAAPWAAVTSFGPVGAHSGPWGQVMAPREATPVESFVLPAGFEADLVHTAGPSEGSWASMTFGPEGEIYVSPERGKLLRFRFPDGHDAAPQVEMLDTPVHSAQGLAYAFDALYANVAGGAEGDGGLHRIRDRDGDGVFEEYDHLAKYGPPSEHGAHGIVLGPDGMLYVVNGNHTGLPAPLAAGSPYRDWAEDVLLPRLWDPRGHAVGVMAPGAVVLRTDADATSWELVAGGMRNPYDLAFAPDGELFTYDADMEWDIGAPWYRAPRVVQVVPGGESGWRSGSAKWPAEYPDSLPPVVETGPSSPVGVVFGTKSNFPMPWRTALFLGDWAYGRILAVDLEAGFNYRGRVLEFLRGKPLNITDLEFGPDGALWFVTGGRGSQSGLYRVRWTGVEAEAALGHDWVSPFDNTRRKLEDPKTGLEWILASLAHEYGSDRSAARRALERRPASEWRAAVLGHDDPLARAEGLLALTRVDPAGSSAEVRRRILEWDFAAAASEVRWLLLRSAMLLRTRDPALGQAASERTSPDPEMAAYFGAAFPSGDPALDRELARMLVAVEAPGLAPRLLERLFAAEFQEQQIHYALLLRLVETGWTPADRLRYFRWLRAARGLPGGLSLSGFLNAIEGYALARVPEAEAEALLAQLPPPATAGYQPPAIPRPFVREWTVAEALGALDADGLAGDPARGAALFRELSCVQCHRSGGDGGSLGPDLSAVANRFSRRDILEAVIEPKKAVSDQFLLVPMPPNLLDSVDAAGVRDLIRFLEDGTGR